MRTSADLLIAAFLCVISSAVWLFTYMGLEAISGKSAMITTPIQAGSTSYALVHQESCVGIIETELHQGDSIVLSSTGSINTTYQDKHRRTELDIQARFDANSELESAHLHINSPLLNLNVEATGGQKIEVTIQGSMRDQHVEETITLVGPINADLVEKQMLNVAYVQQGLLRPEFWRFLQSSLLTSLNVKVLENQDFAVNCSEDVLGALALDPLIHPNERSGLLQQGMY